MMLEPLSEIECRRIEEKLLELETLEKQLHDLEQLDQENAEKVKSQKDRLAVVEDKSKQAFKEIQAEQNSKESSEINNCNHKFSLFTGSGGFLGAMGRVFSKWK